MLDFNIFALLLHNRLELPPFYIKTVETLSKESYFPFNISAAPQTLYSAGFHSYDFNLSIEKMALLIDFVSYKNQYIIVRKVF
jgi:hypothetical protein